MQDTPIQVQAVTNEGIFNIKLNTKQIYPYCFFTYFFCCLTGPKPIIVRKIIRNGQPEETSEAKKDAAKSVETKTQKSEPMEVEVDKKEKFKMKPSIKPTKVFHF